MTKQETIIATRSDFIEKIGLVGQDEGLPKIAGRIFGLLLFDGEPVSFGDLAERLQVSRASVSTSVRLLQERGLVKRVSKPGDRQDYWRLADDPFGGLLALTVARTAAAQQEIEASIEALPRCAEGPRTRLKTYSDFYGAIEAGLRDALERLQGPKTK